MKEKVKYYLINIWFNLSEIAFIIYLGLFLNLEIKHILMIILTFAIFRTTIPNPKHYKKWYLCFIWSSTVFFSLYLTVKIELPLAILFTVFTVFILSGKADIRNIFMWKGKTTKYTDVEDYIKYHSYDDKLIEFENKIKKQDNLDYLIYKYRFKDNLTFEEISEKLDIQTNRITEKLDRIAFALRLYCGI